MRIEGADRYATAIAASKAAFSAAGSCDSVIIATGDKFPDAVVAAGLAGAARCPVLLVSGSTLRSDVRAEIRRLTSGKSRKTVYILGSTAAVSSAMEASIRSALGSQGVTYKRFSGATRYQTAQLVAAEVKARAGSRFLNKAVLVTGADFPDGLLAGPACYDGAMPILLAGTSVDSGLKNTLHNNGITRLAIIGSTRSVSTSAEGQLRTYLGASAVSRVADGTDAYAQSVKVADWAAAERGFTWRLPGFARVTVFADGLGAGVSQGISRCPVLLTPTNSLPSAIRTALSAHRSQVEGVRFFGSDQAISPAVRTAVMDAVR